MAQYVADGAATIPGMEIRVRPVQEAQAEDVLWCDGMAVGSPTHIGTVSWQLKKFFDETLLKHWGTIDGKLGCSFTASGGWGGGAELTCQTINNMLVNYGFLVFGVVDFVDPIHTLHYGAIAAKAPRDAYAQKSCNRLGQRLAEWLAVYVEQRTDLHPLKTRTVVVPRD